MFFAFFENKFYREAPSFLKCFPSMMVFRETCILEELRHSKPGKTMEKKTKIFEKKLGASR